MKVTDFISGEVRYDKEGQYFWIVDDQDGMQMLGELRGWGRIQNMFSKNGKYDEAGAGAFQDEIGEWVAKAINEKRERDSIKVTAEGDLISTPLSEALSDEIRAKAKALWLSKNVNNSNPKVQAILLIRKEFELSGFKVGLKKAVEIIEKYCL